MKVRQAIELARGLKQIDQVNYPDILMLQFLNECEGKLQTEFLHIADVDCQRYTEDDMEMDLIVGPPHDKLYYAYLCAMVDFTNGEYAKYNNSIIVANAFMAEWAAWFNRTHERDGRQYLGVFLSAYGIAVKHGYAGTEEEWLESLRGPEGQQGIQGKPGPQGAPGTVSFDELTEEQLAMLMGPEGQQGVPGTDGVGIQSVEQTTTSTEDGGTNVVTVTKTDGTTSTFYVRNGSRGSTGPAGSDGQDGVPPLVSVSEITGGHRVSIQDADGTSSFDVMDGKDGADGQDGKDGQSGAAGADGITPTIGANGNWYVGQTDTGVAATGHDGKSAYQYAVEGGYTGTEEAFAAKLAKEMPDKLPNPNALKFTGAVSGSYDGSAPLEVEIPSGGGGITITNTATVGQTIKVSAVDENGQPTEWEAVDMASGGGGTTSDEWIDLGTLTLADGEEAINFSWEVNGQVKKIHIEGVYYSSTSGKTLSLFNSDGLSGPYPLITHSIFKFPSSAEKAMYMDLTVEELYPGYWFGVGGASNFNNPHENTIASYSSPKRVDSYLSLGAYWRDTPLTAGTWFNVKVVYY